jgi:hypothetical protein
MGQRNPLDRPGDGGHGKQRNARAGRQIHPEPGRRMKDDVTLAQHDAAVFGPRHEGVKNRKLMVEPCAGEADRKHQRNTQVPQRLVEIRTVLFGNLVEDRVAQRAPVSGGGDGIEIARSRPAVSGPPP